ncbi:MAG TPA: hypothetical protein DEA73_03465 [Peptococcaceae bacterium]|nr:hypothetical protein [Peptococcaceae bacterium]
MDRELIVIIEDEGPDYCGDPKTVDVHIRRLREKLEDNPARPVYLQTAWGGRLLLKPRPGR